MSKQSVRDMLDRMSGISSGYSSKQATRDMLDEMMSRPYVDEGEQTQKFKKEKEQFRQGEFNSYSEPKKYVPLEVMPTQDETNRFNQISSKNAKIYDNYVNTPIYKNASPQEKVKILTSIPRNVEESNFSDEYLKKIDKQSFYEQGKLDKVTNLIGRGLRGENTDVTTGNKYADFAIKNVATPLIQLGQPLGMGKTLGGLTNSVVNTTGNVAKNVFPKIGKYTQSALEGSTGMIPFSMFNSAQEGENTKDSVKRLVSDVAIGVPFGIGGKALEQGIKKVATPIINKISNRLNPVIGNVEESNAFKSNPQESIPQTERNIINTENNINNTVKNNPIESSVTKESNIKYDLPDDEIELTKMYNDLKTKQSKGVNVDLQLFSELERKLGKFATNSVRKNVLADPDHYEAVAELVDLTHGVKTNVNTIKNSEIELSRDYEGTKNKILKNGVNSAEDTASAYQIATDLREEAKKTGDVSILANFIKSVQKTAVNAGQTSQAFVIWGKDTAESALMKASKKVGEVVESVRKNNPKLMNQVDAKTNEVTKDLTNLKQATEKVIDDIFNIDNKKSKKVSNLSFKNNTRTSFSEMLQKKISGEIQKNIDVSTPQSQGYIKNIINDLFGEAKEQMIKITGKKKLPDESTNMLNVAYKDREYINKLRSEAQRLLLLEFSNDPVALKTITEYFTTGNKSPHSQKLLNDILNKRLGGLNLKSNQQTFDMGNDVVEINKPNIKDWVKDWYNSGRESRENFIDSIMKEVGLTGDEANSLRNTIESKLQIATKQTKDKLLNQIMDTVKKPTIAKKATQKLTELTNFGLLDNQKFTKRIGEKISPEIRKILNDNGLNLNSVIEKVVKNKTPLKNVAKMTESEKRNAKATVLRDIFKNTKVDDNEIVKLLDVVNTEFAKLTKGNQKKILTQMSKPVNEATPKTSLERLREKINLGLYDDIVSNEIQDAIKAKYGLPTLSNADVKFISETMDSVQGLDKTSEAYLEGIAKVNKLIAEKTPTSLSRKAGGLGYIGMLLNASSNMANLGGNSVTAIPEIGGNPIARIFDNLIYSSKNYTSGYKTAGKTDFGELYKGIKQGIRQTTRDALGGRNISDLKDKTIREVFEILANPINTDRTLNKFNDIAGDPTRSSFDNNTLRVLENLTSTGLKYGDLPFNVAYYNNQLKQLMTENNVTEPTKDMILTALQVSMERTFKDKNVVSNSALYVKNAFNNMNKGKNTETMTGLNKVGNEASQIIVQANMPFAMTPANIAKRIQEYTPLGVFEGLGKLKANKGQMTMMKQREIVDRLTRGTLGSIGMGLGALGYSMGNITPKIEENKNAQRTTKESGQLSDALKVGNRTYDLNKGLPFTAPIIMGSRVMQGKGVDALGTAVDAFSSATDKLLDNGMLQGVKKIIELFIPESSGLNIDKAKNAMDILTALPKQVLNPQILKKITFALDDYDRNFKDKNLAKYTANSIIGNLPFASKNFPEKVDLFGEPIKRYDGNNNILNTMVNPYVSATIKDNPISKESLRLYNSTIDKELKTGVLMKPVPETVENKSLDIRQQNQYQKIYGDTVKDRISTLLQDSEYVNLSDNDKAIAFNDALSIAGKEAKESMISILNIDTEKIKQDKKEESRYKKDIRSKFK